MKALLLTIALAAVSFAADATGKWTGSFEVTSPEGETRTEQALLIFKQDGTTLTGSGGPNEEEQHAIRNGKVDGDRLSFEIEVHEGVMAFNFKMDGDDIAGEATMTRNGETRHAKFTLTRAKS